MPTTDHELLAQAAKAAGAERTDYSDRTPDHWVIQHADGVWREWNPLNDDGDALRLSARLRISVDYDAPEVGCVAVFWPGAPSWKFEQTSQDLDMPAAIRRAIVRAAAEIGRIHL